MKNLSLAIIILFALITIGFISCEKSEIINTADQTLGQTYRILPGGCYYNPGDSAMGPIHNDAMEFIFMHSDEIEGLTHDPDAMANFIFDKGVEYLASVGIDSDITLQDLEVDGVPVYLTDMGDPAYISESQLLNDYEKDFLLNLLDTDYDISDPDQLDAFVGEIDQAVCAVVDNDMIESKEFIQSALSVLKSSASFWPSFLENFEEKKEVDPLGIAGADFAGGFAGAGVGAIAVPLAGAAPGAAIGFVSFSAMEAAWQIFFD